MTIIEQIKAEIEKRIRRGREVKDRYDSNTSSFVEGSIDALDGLLSFLSTLESEKSMNQEGFEEEVHNYLKIHPLHIKDGGRVVFDNDDSPNFMCDVRDIASHFAQWGAKHLKK